MSEEQNNYETLEKFLRDTRIRVYTTASIDLKKQAEEANIKLSEALDFGIKFLLAEKDFGEYPHNKLSDTIAKYQRLLEEQHDKP